MARINSCRTVVFLLPLILAVIGAPVVAQVPTGRISGEVRATDGTPLRGAQVAVDGMEMSSLSAPDGAFLLRSVPAGRQRVTARLIGFAPVTQEIEVQADRVTRVEIVLSQQVVTLGGITVLGIRSYGANTSSSALKMDARTLDVPQSVVVIGEDFIADQNATNLDDLFRNVAGLTPFSDYQDFTARGFRQGEEEVTFNGVRANATNFFGSPNLHNIERVEIVKGPASVLYGSLEGGAMVNMVTKSPRTIPTRNMTLSAGTYEDYSSSVDLTGPLMRRENLLYRMTAHYDNAGSYKRFVRNKDWHVAPALTWLPRDGTTITIKGEVLFDDKTGARNRGIGAPLGDLNALPISWTSNEPTDVANSKAYTGEINLEHGFTTSSWRANATARYAYSQYVNKYHESQGFSCSVAPTTADLADCTNRGGRLLMRRQFRHQSFNWKNFGTSATVGGNVRTGPIEHRLMFGGDLTFKERLTDPNDYASPVSPLDVFDPQYGNVDLEEYKTMAPENNPFTRDYRDWGLHVQNLITLVPQVKVLLGYRYNDYYIKNANYRLNTLDEHNRTSTTRRAGIVFQPLVWTSFYGNFSEGFKPQTNSQEERGGPFDPLITRQFEGGFKFSLFGDRLIASSSKYRITKLNVLVPDPDPESNLLVTLGEVRSEGWEIDLVGSVTRAWSVTANYANNNTEITEDPRPAVVGSRFPNAPKNSAAFWTRYDLTRLNVGLAAGASYVDERDTFDATVLPSYTVYDAALFYDWARYKFAVNVKNLMNERYFSGGYNNYQIWTGSPRTVQASVRATF